MDITEHVVGEFLSHARMAADGPIGTGDVAIFHGCFPMSFEFLRRFHVADLFNGPGVALVEKFVQQSGRALGRLADLREIAVDLIINGHAVRKNEPEFTREGSELRERQAGADDGALIVSREFPNSKPLRPTSLGQNACAICIKTTLRAIGGAVG